MNRASPHPSSAFLQVRNLGKAFGGVVAVDSVSFDVQAGHIKGIIGPNGAGKSTLLNLVSGVLSPDNGEVWLDGTRLDCLPGHEMARHGMARTFQLLRLFGNNDASVLDNVLLGAHTQMRPGVLKTLLGGGQAERQQRERARAWLDFFGLADCEQRQPQSLAFGQQRYVELARAMMLEPRLLLLDEPASGLNEAEVLVFGDMLRKLSKQGTTIVLIEHDMKLVMSITNEILVLAQGRRLADGTPDQVRTDPQVIDAYLGTDSQEVAHA